MKPAARHEPLLVGIDEAGRSDEAMRAALDLSRRLGAELFAVHALPAHHEAHGLEEATALAGPHADAAAERSVRDHLDTRLREIVSDAGRSELDVSSLLRVMRGPAARVLLEAAREHGASTIFLGPHERRGLLDFGSTARAVLAKSSADVWVQPGRHAPIARVLVPIDLSKDSLHALRIACSYAACYEASITVLHCFVPLEVGYAPSASYPVPGPTYVLEEVRASARREFDRVIATFDWQGVAHDARFLEGRPASSVLEMQDSCDLIALGSHGRTGLSAVLLGNVAYSVLRESRKPVLAIRLPGRQFLL